MSRGLGDVYKRQKLYRSLESHLRQSDLAFHCAGLLDQSDLPAHLLPVFLYFIQIQQKIPALLLVAYQAAFLDQPVDPSERLEQYFAGFRCYQHHFIKTRRNIRADHNDVHGRRHLIWYGICPLPLYGAAFE